MMQQSQVLRQQAAACKATNPEHAAFLSKYAPLGVSQGPWPYIGAAGVLLAPVLTVCYVVLCCVCLGALTIWTFASQT